MRKKEPSLSKATQDNVSKMREIAKLRKRIGRLAKKYQIRSQSSAEAGCLSMSILFGSLVGPFSIYRMLDEVFRFKNRAVVWCF
ncbi:hypothetical protein BH20ACI2_BH20ACI2_11480 [soil metagenome]